MSVWLLLALALFAAYGLATLISGLPRAWITFRRRVVPPCYSLMLLVRDRADVLEGLVHNLAGAWGEHRYELVIVDDGSRDDTPAILRRLARRYPGLKTVVMAETDTRQSPVEIGLFLCRNRVVVLVDLTRAVDPGEILAMLGHLFGHRGSGSPASMPGKA